MDTISSVGTPKAIDVELTESDIPGASLNEPLDRHTIPELKWWLLCRGVTVSSSIKKSQLIDRYYFEIVHLLMESYVGYSNL